MIDIPKISQRSIIAYCDASGTAATDNNVWFPIDVREPLTVTSLTSATLKVNGGNEAVLTAGGTNQGLKVAVSGNSIMTYAYLHSDAYSYMSYGYDATGSFTLTVTTAGDVQRGIEGTTRTWTINVLLLGKDWPYSNAPVLYFRVGQKVNHTFNLTKHAARWYDAHASTGFPSGEGAGDDVVSAVQVGGNYASSGLTLLWNDNPEARVIHVEGTATRAGLYRVQLEMNSQIEDSGIGAIRPYWGGDGTTIVLICVYEPYMKGNLVVMADSPVELPPRDFVRVTHAPSFGAAGYGEFLTGANFTRWTGEGYNHWSAAVPQYGTSGIAQYWYFRIEDTTTKWELWGYRLARQSVNQEEFAGKNKFEIAAMAAESEILAVADLRISLLSECPPKRGWRSSSSNVDLPELVLVGDMSWYVDPEAFADNGGWYNFAGGVVFSNGDTLDAVFVYERSAHWVADQSGWNIGAGLSFSGERYLVNIDGGWMVTSDKTKLDSLPDVSSGWTEVEVSRGNQGVAVPYCPGKEGDFGVLAKAADGSDVFHSLSNQFPGSMLRDIMGSIAGAQWEFFPMRRLLSLWKTGASCEIIFSGSDERSTETGSGDSGAWWHNYDREEGAPTVAELKAAANRQITVGRTESITLTTVSTKVQSGATINLGALPYAVWDERRLLSELCDSINRTSGVTGTLSESNSSNGKIYDKWQRYKLYRPRNDAPIAPWDYNYRWRTHTASGSMDRVEVYKTNGNTTRRVTTHETYSLADGIWTKSGTEQIETWDAEGYHSVTNQIVPSNTPRGSVTAGVGIGERNQVDQFGVSHPNGFIWIAPRGLRYFDDDVIISLAVDDTSSVEKSASGSYTSSSGPDVEGHSRETSVTSSATFTFRQVAENPWDFSDKGTDYDDFIDWKMYVAAMRDHEVEEITEGPTGSTSAISSPTTEARARTFFGDGRDSDDPHRILTVAASVFGGYGGSMALASGSAAYTIKQWKTYAGERYWNLNLERWDYSGYYPNAPDGTPMTDAKWGVRYLTYSYDGTGTYKSGSAQVGATHSFNTGFVKALLLAMLTSGVSLSGSHSDDHDVVSCEGEYLLTDGVEYVTWNKSGEKRTKSESATGLPSSNSTVIPEGKIDPANVSPDQNAPRDQSVEYAYWETSRHKTRFSCSFSMAVRDSSDDPPENG